MNLNVQYRPAVFSAAGLKPQSTPLFAAKKPPAGGGDDWFADDGLFDDLAEVVARRPAQGVPKAPLDDLFDAPEVTVDTQDDDSPELSDGPELFDTTTRSPFGLTFEQIRQAHLYERSRYQGAGLTEEIRRLLGKQQRGVEDTSDTVLSAARRALQAELSSFEQGDRELLDALLQADSKEESKQVFRRLSMRYHPDLNAHPKAGEQFGLISKLYNALPA